jgi:hypothetical protein
MRSQFGGAGRAGIGAQRVPPGRRTTSLRARPPPAARRSENDARSARPNSRREHSGGRVRNNASTSSSFRRGSFDPARGKQRGAGLESARATV